MTYYRLAIQDQQTAKWIWKSTALTSLQAMFELLRIYGKRPQISTRVFTASSKEELNEMLGRQNNNLASGSLTAEQFLQERNLAVRNRVQSASEQHGADVAAWAKEVWEKHEEMRTAQATQPGAAIATSSLIGTIGASSSPGLSLLEQKRLEIERGAGGDHDTPYLFTLPISMKERLAWTRLQTRVRDGELAS